jgi:hypothetical protein
LELKLQRCPNCDESLAADSINIAEGVALCPRCGTLSRLSGLIQSSRSIQEILAQPPSGCSVQSDGRSVSVIVSHRSILSFVTCTGIALFWNGIVSVFALFAVAGLYSNLIGPLPDWFPAAGIQDGKPIMNGQPMGIGETLFLCVFLTPFVTVGAALIFGMVFSLLGNTKIVIDEYESWAATGVLFLRWKQRFDPRRTQSVHFGSSLWNTDESQSRAVELVADRTIKIGSGLPDERLEWLRALLISLLLHDERDPRRSEIPNVARPLWIRSD